MTNGWIWNFHTFSTLHILAKFNTFSRSCTPISQFHTFSILSLLIPCGSPEPSYNITIWSMSTNSAGKHINHDLALNENVSQVQDEPLNTNNLQELVCLLLLAYINTAKILVFHVTLFFSYKIQQWNNPVTKNQQFRWILSVFRGITDRSAIIVYKNKRKKASHDHAWWLLHSKSVLPLLWRNTPDFALKKSPENN